MGTYWQRTQKYGNRKMQTDEGTFDSVKEYYRWLDLRQMVKAGIVSDLQRQVHYQLIPAQKIGGKTVEKACTYIADFVYKDKSGNTVVEDVKGVKTEVYKIKKKLMLWRYGIHIKEV